MKADDLPTDNGHRGPPPLRFQFVGMLFALAVAEVAVKWAEVAADLGLSATAWPAHLHLALAISIISTSWIGWSRSLAPGNVRSIEHPFSVEFLILLVDVALVILYFMVARSVDEFTKAALEPSAKEEFHLVATIFGLYFLWDFLTLGLAPSKPRDLERVVHFWPQGVTSGSCFVILLVASFFLSRVDGSLSVALADLGLISLVFFFRAWKGRLWPHLATTGAFVIALFTLSYYLG